MTAQLVDLDLDRQIKAAHRSMWASGDYPAVAAEVISALGPVLTEATGIAAGERVIDIAAGSGNATIPAALAGGVVTATDLTPELFEPGGRATSGLQVDITWQAADAERLPFDDGAFDVAISCVGIMFAPFHDRAAGELLRVVRPGGRIGLINWTPTGFIGAMFATMKPYNAPPPAGAQPPPLWGDPDHLADLFGNKIRNLHTERRVLAVDRFADAEEFLDFFKRTYGPTIAIFNRLAGDPASVAELDAELLALARDYFRPGESVMEWEYLLATADVL